MGRRDPKFPNDYLRSWAFFGRDETGVWNLLHTQSNQNFSYAEIRTYPLYVNRSFSAFKIQMIDTSTHNQWVLCLGQIEVFGDIYRRPYKQIKCTQNGLSSHRSDLHFIQVNLI